MTTDTPLTDAARQKYYDGTPSEWVHYKIAMMLEHELGELERELQSLSNRLENMTDSRDCMIEDRNLLSAKVKRLHTENFCLKEQIQEFYEHLAFWPFMLGSLVIASIGFFYTLGKTQTGTFGDPIMALLWWLLPLTVILLKLGTYLPR